MTAGKGAGHSWALVAVSQALEVTPVTPCGTETPRDVNLTSSPNSASSPPHFQKDKDLDSTSGPVWKEDLSPLMMGSQHSVA